MQNSTQAKQWFSCAGAAKQTKLRLFCFPYAGGSASIFRTWQMNFPDEVSICPLQLPGRAARISEPLIHDFSTLVENIAEAIKNNLDTPFAFFGHSLGGLLSFELVRRLRRENLPLPVHLFISGCSAPQIPDTDPPIHDLSDAEFLEEIRRYGGMPDEILSHPELLKIILPVLRADFSICDTYRYIDESPLDVPITVFGGLEDETVDYESLAAWRAQSNRAFTIRRLSGGHFFLDTNRELLLKTLVRELYLILDVR